MSMERILAEIRGLDGVLELAPQPGSGHPPTAWGDYFFYYAPDGQMPGNRQPYATIVTKNYPDDAASLLDPPDRWRLNIHVRTEVFQKLLGYAPRDVDLAAVDVSEADVLVPHPVYGRYGWVAIVNPASATTDRALQLLHGAHGDDRRRVEGRGRKRT